MDEIFWLAGLLEAEGSFVAAPPSDPKRPRISLAMTDADIVERVSRLFGGTAIQQQAGRVQGWKATYRTLARGSRAMMLMGCVYPAMSTRRQQQIGLALASVGQSVSPDFEQHDWRIVPIANASPTQQLDWLAGLLEGEGSFLPGPPSRPNTPAVTIQMNDQEVIAQVALLFGVSWHQMRESSGNRAAAYATRLRGKQAMDLMQQIYSRMGLRRQSQIDTALASYQPGLRGRSRRIDLTETIVLDIFQRASSREPYQKIVDDYVHLGVTKQTIKDIRRGQSWGWLTDKLRKPS